jgi:cellulose synthase/poly-beta-1,6-N-acetylglucosamine synthase-like glycosyltransferase
MIFLVVALWTSVLLLIYSYFCYPFLLRIMHLIHRVKTKKSDEIRSITLIIAAYNEEKHIAAKLENTLQLDYPREMLQVVVASDGSTDRTDALVLAYENHGIELLRIEGRRGKTAAQNAASRIAHGEILVFSDATTVYHPGVLRQIIKPFADQSVGCVSGKLLFIQKEGTNFEGEKNTSEAYDQAVKNWESDIWSICGVNGCLYAVRRNCFVEIADYLTSDFVIPLKILEMGLRVVYEPEAVCFESPCRDASGEFNRKIRTSRAGITGAFFLRHLLNPFQYPWIAFCLIHHKVLRWLSPLLLMIAIVANAGVMNVNLFYKATMLCQFFFYFCALLGFFNEKYKKKIRLFTVPFNFLLINFAALFGWIDFLKGNLAEVWETNRD